MIDLLFATRPKQKAILEMRIKGYKQIEIAKKMKISRQLYDYLAEKFPKLKNVYNQIKSNCETNCFVNAKKGNIKEATAIVNLKSNHKWTDRQDMTSAGEKISVPIIAWISPENGNNQ
jgi:ribosome-associated translation inhibitor RaiA